MPVGLVGFDKRALRSASSLVGIDEVGRGCLAGPVVAVAIRCEASFYSTSWCRRNSRGVDDSKRLSSEKRAAIVKRFEKACRDKWIQTGLGTASVEEIEEHNIYQATTLAMRRAVEHVLEGGLDSLAESASGGDTLAGLAVLIDGRPIRAFPLPHAGIVKGDQRSLAIALAGIHAKEWRDEHMRELDARFPEYGFAKHKGYGTKQHIEALKRHGPSPHHRASFLRKVFTPPDSGPIERQDSLF